MSKRIFITGGSGYIGQYLVRYLRQKKFLIFAPTHSQIDLLDTGAVVRYLKKHPVDVVIHGAVVGGSRKEEEVERSLEFNLRMFLNVFNCHQYYKKFIHLGSGAEYGKYRPLRQVNETEFGKYVPKDDYGLYKYIASKMIEERNTPEVVNLRIFGLYGPGENYRLRFISNMIVRNIFGLPLEILQDAYFDYVYIKDFVRIVEYFINHSTAYKSYNIGSGTRLRLTNIAKKINDLFNGRQLITIKKRGLNREYTANNTRLMSELRSFTFTHLDTALEEMYHWYKEQQTNLSLG